MTRTLLKRRSIVKGSKSHYYAMSNKSSNPNKSPTNEDRFAVRNFANFSLFAVFDGHMGDKISQYSASNFLRFLGSYLRSHGPTAQSFGNAFRLFDQKIQGDLPRSNDGCTATVVYVDPQRIVTANLGDSHVFLLSPGHQPRLLTTEHSWENKVERKRIQDAGGKFEDGYYVVGNNMIQPTRGFGDWGFKRRKGPKGQELYTAIPSVTEIPMTNGTLIIATDGIGSPQAAMAAMASVGHQDPPTMASLLATHRQLFSGRSGEVYYPDDLTLIVVDLLALRRRFKD